MFAVALELPQKSHWTSTVNKFIINYTIFIEQEYSNATDSTIITLRRLEHTIKKKIVYSHPKIGFWKKCWQFFFEHFKEVI